MDGKYEVSQDRLIPEVVNSAIGGFNSGSSMTWDIIGLIVRLFKTAPLLIICKYDSVNSVQSFRVTKTLSPLALVKAPTWVLSL